jgi:transcriptional regulator with XRE-family HTH domain
VSKLGDTIRNKRREMGLSQADLADDVMVSDTYIAKIEVGERYPSPKVLYRIADVLQMPFEELTVLNEPNVKFTGVKLLSEVDKKLLALPLRIKMALLEVAETMKKMP